MPKGNYWILRIGVVASRQKLGIIFSNKVVLKLKSAKNAFYKKCAPKLIFFNENCFGKICIIFDIESWLWKSDFWQLTATSVHKIQ